MTPEQLKRAEELAKSSFGIVLPPDGKPRGDGIRVEPVASDHVEYGLLFVPRSYHDEKLGVDSGWDFSEEGCWPDKPTGGDSFDFFNEAFGIPREQALKPQQSIPTDEFARKYIAEQFGWPEDNIENIKITKTGIGWEFKANLVNTRPKYVCVMRVD